MSRGAARDMRTSLMKKLIRIGVAGWGVPKALAAEFPGEGPHLARYARRFAAVEIDTSFDRSHKPETYARWAASAPPDFRFAVKAPREITHRRRLVDAAEPLDRFLAEIERLGDKLGPILVQLPPSLSYDEATVAAFFETLRARHEGDVACEPRHLSWFEDCVDALLSQFRIARVAADPPPAPRAAAPGGWPGLVYYRWHGAPKVYYSDYDATALDAIAQRLRAPSAAGSSQTWCIFDNTALGEATKDALSLMGRLSEPAKRRARQNRSTHGRNSTSSDQALRGWRKTST
jgi:uncharacterized protein YecE (DUF72 family)